MFLKLNIDRQLYFSNEFEPAVTNILRNDSFSDPIPERNGIARTTSYKGNDEIIFHSEAFCKLFEQISDILLKTKNLFNAEYSNHILYKRVWINEMFKNSSGKIHVHNGDHDGVAIFYYKVPENSGRFVIVDENSFSEKNLNIDDYEMNDLTFIKVNEGDVIIHKKCLPHGVSKHFSEETRICFVFDFKFA